MTLSIANVIERPPGFLNRVANLVHTHRARLLAYAMKRGLSAEDALDVVQDGFATFLRLPQAQTAHTEEDALKLLTVLVRHQLQNRRRQNARTLPTDLTLQDEESSEDLVARAEELARVNGCILRMNALQGDVIRLSLLDERPHEEISALLGISNGHVRVLLHRAREHVRHCEDRV